MMDRGSASAAQRRQQLVDAAETANVTLVLGAGLSNPYHLPGWTEYTQRVWENLPLEGADWETVSGGSSTDQAMMLPILFELAQRHQRDSASWMAHLRRCLYQDYTCPEHGTSLDAVAKAIVREWRKGKKRRIRRIVTLNLDDLLEKRISHHSEAGEPNAIPVVSPHDRLSEAKVDRTQRIPIFHLHGYVGEKASPDDGERWAPTLILTDSDYWKAAGRVAGYVNRILAGALDETHCMFIGLSMKDSTPLRLLSYRQDEMQGARRSDFRSEEQPSPDHYWINLEKDDPSGTLTRFLETCRGVTRVPVASWSEDHFGALMERAFPPFVETGHARVDPKLRLT